MEKDFEYRRVPVFHSLLSLGSGVVGLLPRHLRGNEENLIISPLSSRVRLDFADLTGTKRANAKPLNCIELGVIPTARWRGASELNVSAILFPFLPFPCLSPHIHSHCFSPRAIQGIIGTFGKSNVSLLTVCVALPCQLASNLISSQTISCRHPSLTRVWRYASFKAPTELQGRLSTGSRGHSEQRWQPSNILRVGDPINR